MPGDRFIYFRNFHQVTAERGPSFDEKDKIGHDDPFVDRCCSVFERVHFACLGPKVEYSLDGNVRDDACSDGHDAEHRSTESLLRTDGDVVWYDAVDDRSGNDLWIAVV
jgi:hypothetical protein